jgi:hypothetical protein
MPSKKFPPLLTASAGNVIALSTPKRHRSESPDAPSYSPITPTGETNQIRQNYSNSVSPMDKLKQKPLNEPPPPGVPISESENPDAIALRSALSILQMQRQGTLRDIQTLRQQKEKALANPNEFAQEITAGRVRTVNSKGLVEMDEPENDSEDQGEEDDFDMDKTAVEEQRLHKSKFGTIPGPRNIVRAPPINWDKYHVVGKGLEAIHEEQRKRPSSGDSVQDQLASEHVIAAPWRPFEDKLEKKPRSSSTSFVQ